MQLQFAPRMPGEYMFRGSHRPSYVTIPSAERLDPDMPIEFGYIGDEPVAFASRDEAVTGRRVTEPITMRRLQYELDYRRGLRPTPPDLPPEDGLPVVDLSGTYEDVDDLGGVIAGGVVLFLLGTAALLMTRPRVR